jgi:cytoskeletal protein CcmA (bactofilin family)
MGIFSAKADQQEPPLGGLSVISAGMTVRGDIESNGTVKVEGAVEGQVQARHQVLVAKGGSVHGDIDAREAVIGGMVHGAIKATERVEVQSGATVNGDITTLRIAVAEGGNLNGAIRMRDVTADARPADPQAASAASRAEPRAAGPSPTSPIPGKARPSVPVARVAVPPRLPASGSGY